MLQFVDSVNDRFSVSELAQMAIEGGCRWIQMHLPDLPDEEVKALLVPDVVDMCRETGTFLMLENRPALARELGLHGVHLTRSYFVANPADTPAQIREELGPEAVIGVEITKPEEAVELARRDIDYVSLPATWDISMVLDLVEAVRGADCKIPIVATGILDIQQALEAIAVGADGVAVGTPIANAHDPAIAMEEYLSALNSK